MAGTTLEKLLEYIRDGEATAAQIARARELAAHDGRLPQDIRGDVLQDELESDAVALLSILGNDNFGDLLKEALCDELDIADDVMVAICADTSPIGDAVRDEAGDIGIGRGPVSASVLFTAQTLEELGDLGLPIRDAVVAEGGSVDIAARVMIEVGVTSIDVASAVQAEAGPIDVSNPVLNEIGGESVGLRDAVIAEAGEAPDVWAGVIDIIGTREALIPEAPVVAFPPEMTVSPVTSSASDSPVVANNNDRWAYGFGALMMAAIALIVVGLTQVPAESNSTTTGDEQEMLSADTELVFASASDVIVENLEYGDDVVVMQLMGDGGAMILWVDEGEVL